MVVVVIDRNNTEFSEVQSEQVKSSPKFTEAQLVEIQKSQKSKMPVERRGVRALQIWCQRVTSDYPSVTITDMSTSWRVRARWSWWCSPWWRLWHSWRWSQWWQWWCCHNWSNWRLPHCCHQRHLLCMDGDFISLSSIIIMSVGLPIDGDVLNDIDCVSEENDPDSHASPFPGRTRLLCHNPPLQTKPHWLCLS